MDSELRPWKRSIRKGGFRACMFVYALAGLDGIGSVANLSMFVLYFKTVMQFDISQSANTLTNYIGSTYLLSLLGAFISDTYLTRLTTCLSFGFLQIAALIMITIQAYSKGLQPDPCDKPVCVKGGEAAMFYISLTLLALGAGGVRGSLAPLGADQFDRNQPKGAKGLASYFNGLMLSVTFGAIIGVTAVIWISFRKGWYWGFFIGTITSTIGFIFLALGKPFYLNQPPGISPISRVTQVFVIAIRNRKLPLPEDDRDLYDIDEEERQPWEEKVLHTNQFRCLDRAAIVREDGELVQGSHRCLKRGAIVSEDGELVQGRQGICTVTQVEEVKVLIRMFPILASTIIMNTCLSQLQTFSMMQGYSMDPHLGSFDFPSASIPVIPLFFMCVLIPIYEFIFVPFARKYTGHPAGIPQLRRVGVGLILCALSMAIAAVVEVKRRDRALKSPQEKPLSLFWLSFQFGIFGVADMFTMVGLMEFFYKEAPAGMKSLSTSFAPLSLAFGAFLSSVVVDLFNWVTGRISGNGKGWLYGKDLNHNRLDVFFWFLAILSSLNFANYLFWAKWYKYRESQQDTNTNTNNSPHFTPQMKELLEQ
ncbi:protein NRT1/ PTR FAMILY 4.6-like [Impatiens glandulifera]|uniref:protein NRT1/ PTR FAMILY 4.6-like n=1 Tax=Impatiens glandulifera TaxID=253017 RepID=UPI001FB17227|nr:protein NRT1/ PTR FAMILY 4.6-like [Impatiens glandulifera]